MRKKIVILGGYGNTGIKIADLLLNYTDTEIILAARNMDRLNASCKQLNEKYKTSRVSSIYADASNKESLLRAFKGIDMVLVASGTAEYTRTVTLSVLEAGIDYLDVQYSTKKFEILQSMTEEIEKSDLCFITEAGFHPGLPAALIRYGAQYFDELKTAVVGSVIKQDWKDLEIAPSTQREFVEEIMDVQLLIYKDGKWKKGSMWSTKDFIDMNFFRGSSEEPNFGIQKCVPMFLEELRPLPDKYPSLKNMGFYIAGFNWFVDLVVFPFIMVVLKLFPRKGLNPMSKLMGWSLEVSSRPPFGIVLKLEAGGIKDGKQKAINIFLYHEDGYWFTAIPVAACLIQYLDGSIQKSGIWTMGNLVDPNRLMKDMERMGIVIWEQDG